MMKNDIRVIINSQMINLLEAESENGVEKTEYINDGVITDNGKTIELTYAESVDMGFDAQTYTTLLFDKQFPKRVNMTRTGSNTAGLCFDPDVKRQMCALSVGDMSMEFCIQTNMLKNFMTLQGGAIDLDYILEFHGCRTQRTILHIEACRKEQL